MSTIYHIVQFEDGSAYLMFDVCDWRCSYCIRNVSSWCTSLPEATIKTLNRIEHKYINIDELLKIFKENGVKLAFLGGGEPTQDSELKAIMRLMKENGIDSWLITNGELLDEEIFQLSKGITFSIKAIDEAKHIKLTGRSNRSVLNNYQRFGNDEKVVAETVYYPNIIGCEEVQKIAEFVHSVNPRARFRIDPAVQLRDKSGLKDCVEKIRLIHENTYYFEFAGKSKPPKLLYPKI